MTDVIYPGPILAVDLPDGTRVEMNTPTTVADEYVEGLVNCGWSVAPPPKSKGGSE